MTEIRTTICVAADGSISGRVSSALPPGEHEAIIEVAVTRRKPKKHFDINKLPTLDLGPWPGEVTLRREEIYDIDGR